MKLRDFLYDKTVTLCFLTGAALAASVFLYLYTEALQWIFWALAAYGIIVAAWLVCAFFVQSRRLHRLSSILENIKDPYLLGETLGKPTGLIQQQYYAIMQAVSRDAIAKVQHARHEEEAYCAYVESWVHEIRTPLTACSLILSNGADPVKLKRELKRADNLTETILYYARMREPASDTRIQAVQAAVVIDEALRAQMDLLISAGIRVETGGDFTVYTDAKALCFILTQFLTNCAKYCPGCLIRITAADGQIRLCDNGIGIPPHDLPRITQRGYTGENGRKIHGTGMGLYIAAQLCQTLGIGLEITSKQDKYTQIRLKFENLTKM